DEFDHASDLVAERERQRAAGPHVKLLAIAEQKIAVLHVQVRVAHAAAFDANKDLRALRLRTLYGRLAEWRGIGGERLSAEPGHGTDLIRLRRACSGKVGKHVRNSILASQRSSNARASSTKPSTGTFSARTVGSMPALASSGSGSVPSDF